MPAACIATSVPVAIAMPTSAAASAGASLIPSPTMATTLPSAFSRATHVGLVARQDLGEHPVDAELLRDRIGRARAVAGHHDGFDAARMQAGDRLMRARGLTVSPKATSPSTRASGAVSASHDTVRPWDSSASRLGLERRVGQPVLRDQPPGAEQQRTTVDDAATRRGPAAP